jgi:predicted Abi (CAAX) family protease
MRVVAALTTIPDWRAWGRCALAYGIFLCCALPLGLLTGLLRASVPHVAPAVMLGTSAIVFVHPAFVEELIFRVLLLPRETATIRRGRLTVMAVAALALYVASHPLNAILFRPQLRSLFESSAYLSLAALLGATCTAAYWISRSIWPPVLIHWLTVLVWLYLFGGWALLC